MLGLAGLSVKSRVPVEVCHDLSILYFAAVVFFGTCIFHVAIRIMIQDQQARMEICLPFNFYSIGIYELLDLF